MPGDRAAALDALRHYYQDGPHPYYTSEVEKALNDIIAAADELELSNEEVKEAVEKLADSLADRLSAGTEESSEAERLN